MTYLRPYRLLVIISIVCALFVGLAMTSGLGAMLPIIRVLINGDTVPGWVDRTIVNKRLDAKLPDDPAVDKLILVNVDKKRSTLLAAGYQQGDILLGDGTAPALLRDLADPNRSSIILRAPDGGIRTVHLNPVPFYLIWARQGAGRLPANPVKAIAVVFGLLALLGLAGNVVRFFQEYLSNKAAILAVNDIRRHLYDHLLRVPLGHFGEKGTSDTTSRLVQDSGALQDGFKQVLGQTIQEPIKVVMALALALAYSWQLTLFIIGFAPVMGIIVKKFGKKMYRASRGQLQSSAVMLGQLEATMQGIRVVKAAGAERFERRRYGKIMESLVAQQLRMCRLDAFNTPVMEMLLLSAAGCVVLFGAYLVLIKHQLDSGSFIVVMVALVTMADSLRRISKVTNAIQQSNAAAARVFQAMDLPVEQDRKRKRQGVVKLRPLSKEIKFEGVSFSYPSSSAKALNEVSLTVPKGQSVAVVGRNGSGKTTLLALLPRFYDFQSGSITIDGIDIRDTTLRSLRRQISVVTQDSIIFPEQLPKTLLTDIH